MLQSKLLMTCLLFELLHLHFDLKHPVFESREEVSLMVLDDLAYLLVKILHHVVKLGVVSVDFSCELGVSFDRFSWFLIGLF